MRKLLPLAFGLIASAVAFQPKGSISAKNLSVGQYSQAAKISMKEAVDAALKQQKGEESMAQLSNEGGYLVYQVRVLSPENQYVDVFVDAGDGAILGINYIS